MGLTLQYYQCDKGRCLYGFDAYSRALRKDDAAPHKKRKFHGPFCIAHRSPLFWIPRCDGLSREAALAVIKAES